ncbi:hypothetical protein Tco_1277534, partial [Tanacetum coccineum]
MIELPIMDSGLDVPVFSPGDDPIAYLNKAMAFLIVVASSRVTLQQVQGRQGQSYYGTSYKGNATSSEGNNASGQERTEDLDTYDSDCDDISNAKAVLMTKISNYGSDIISEVPHSETYLNDMENQSVHALQDFEHTQVVDVTDNEITSDSNIILYSQYFQETQQANVQDTNLQAQEDSIILSVIEQMSEQMINHKAQRIKPTLYDGSIISDKHVASPMFEDEETLILEEVSRFKMLAKQNDLILKEKKVNTAPINYDDLNRLSKDFGKRFVPQQELSDEQAFLLQTSQPNTDQSASSHLKIEAPRELPKITPDALTEGEWGFEHTKAVFLKEIILFLKTLKEIFNAFDKDLSNE